MPVPRLSLLGLKRIRGFVSILRYINPTIIITHLATEIHFQTTDHVVAVEKVAEQHIGTKYSKCNSLRVISHIIILGKSATTHSKVGQSSQIPLA